jgi:hypothetical protein
MPVILAPEIRRIVAPGQLWQKKKKVHEIPISMGWTGEWGKATGGGGKAGPGDKHLSSQLLAGSLKHTGITELAGLGKKMRPYVQNNQSKRSWILGLSGRAHASQA